MKIPKRLPPHPLSDAFPMMSEKEFVELKEDIRLFGRNREPIVLYEGMLLDGRNRFRACRELNIEPVICKFEGDDPATFVWQANGLRRMLTVNQKAAIAVDMLPALKEEAKKRMLSGKPHPQARGPEGWSHARAAKLVGISENSVKRAETVKKKDLVNGTKIFEKMRKGEISIVEARDIAVGKPRVPRQKRTKATPERSRHPKLNVSRVISEMVYALDGMQMGLRRLDDSDAKTFEGISAKDAKVWAEVITKSLTSIRRIRDRLQKIASN